MGTMLVLLLIFNLWFCCSVRQNLRQQHMQVKVNESDLELLRRFVEKLQGRLNIAQIGRIPTSIYKKGDSPFRRAWRHLSSRLSRIVDSEIDDSEQESPMIVVRDDDRVFAEPTSSTVSPSSSGLLHTRQTYSPQEVSIVLIARSFLHEISQGRLSDTKKGLKCACMCRKPLYRVTVTVIVDGVAEARHKPRMT